MQINIIYFASLRDASQKSQELIETNANTIDELFLELNEKYQFPLDKKNLKAARNEEYVDFSTALTNNDTIVFIPPVAGG